jgi:hypothetical protein
MMARWVAVLLLLCANPGWADPQSKSFSTWTITSTPDAVEVAVILTIAAREVTRLPAYQFDGDLNRVLTAELERSLSVATSQGQACAAKGHEVQRAREGFLRVALQWSCVNTPASLAVGNQLLFREAPSHIHFARFRIDGQPDFEKLFTRHQVLHTIQLQAQGQVDNRQANTGQTIYTYILFGFEHILIGLDHIAFLLTLMLFARRLRDVVFIVTGFTLGHSITLSLTVLGLATPNLMVVEALIGFTIAMVAVENIVVGSGRQATAGWVFASTAAALALLAALSGIGPPLLSLLGLGLFSLCYFRLSDSRQKARQLRPTITTLFGLIHGFGFASVLLEVGLPADAVIPALFGFNVGVELGQLAIVCAMAALAWTAARFWSWRQAGNHLWLNTGLCGLGVYWFVQRLYF